MTRGCFTFRCTAQYREEEEKYSEINVVHNINCPSTRQADLDNCAYKNGLIM